MATSQMEKSIEISLKDISASTRQNEYRDKLAVKWVGQISRDRRGTFTGNLIFSSFKILFFIVKFLEQNPCF